MAYIEVGVGSGRGHCRHCGKEIPFGEKQVVAYEWAGRYSVRYPVSCLKQMLKELKPVKQVKHSRKKRKVKK